MPNLLLGIDARGSKSGAQEFSKNVTAAGKSATSASKDVDGFSQSMNSAEESSNSFSNSLGGLISVAAGLVIFKDATNVIAGFEETMLTVQGVTGATEEQMASLAGTAREFGATTRFSAQEAGEGLLFLSRAGFDADEAMAALPETLNLATAGALDLGEAADFTSNIMAQFGLSAQETNKVVDVLINTANSANTDVRQLAEAMKFAGPVAGSLGISIDETAAAIGALGDAGIQSSQAGTNLRGILASLLDPSDKAAAALGQLGISLEDVNPDNENLTAIFKEFADANLGAAEAVEIFGRRNVGAALVLADSAEKLRDLTSANEESGGVAQRNASIIESGLTGALLSLRSAVEEVFLAIGEAGLGGSLKDFVGVLTEIRS
jgi:TP901 family phage tail tape measure protein